MALNEPIDISPNKDGKIIKTLLKVGHRNEKPGNGVKVSVHYVGTFADSGTQFDSSRDRRKRFEFTLGGKEVISGWEIAVLSMNKGELASFKIDSEYAYGDRGSPPTIPPNACLNFEIELYDWKLEDLSKRKDGGITRRVIDDGEGWDNPNKGSTCSIEYSMKYKDKVLEKREVTFYLGEGIEEGLVSAVEIAVRKMKKDEKCEIFAKPAYVWGEGIGNKAFGVPNDYEEICFQIHLKSFENVKEIYEMDNNERIEQAMLVKTKGTKYFKEGKYKLAIKQYKRVTQFLGLPEDFEDELRARADEVLLAGYLNLSMCHLKLLNYHEAQNNATKALSFDSKSEKGLFRRGQAYFGQKEYKLALIDFKSVLEIDPNNAASKAHIQNCQVKLKEQNETEKKRFKNMFDNFAKLDSKVSFAFVQVLL